MNAISRVADGGVPQDAARLPEAPGLPSGRVQDDEASRRVSRVQDKSEKDKSDKDDQDKSSDDDDGNDDDKKKSRKDDGDKNDDKDGEKKDDDKDKKPKSRWPIIILIVVAILAAIGAFFYWLSVRDLQSTDDAYTEGNAVSVAPKISGYVIERDIDDNSVVRTGQVLLRIDPRDYITARDQAVANLALARAQLASAQVDLEITRVKAPANLKQSLAQLQQAHANEKLAARSYQRQHSVDQRATTQSNVDQANAQLDSNNASVRSAEAQVAVSSLVRQNIQADIDTVTQRQAQVKQEEANLAQAEINLSYTVIHATQDGYVTRRNFDRGTYAQAGQQIFYIVTEPLWITANFKETQLGRMHPGQRVDVTVDAYDKLKLYGHIDSIQAGSGDRFSTFPAENATGNYVKIVRRVPVKIVIDDGLDPNQTLPLGLSVVPTVHLK